MMSAEDPDRSSRRNAIMSYLMKNPGASMDMISRDLHITRGTLRYHLDLLMRKGKVISRDMSRRKVFFLTDRRSRSYIRSKTPLSTVEKRILSVIAEEPGTPKIDIYRRSNIPKKRIDYILGKLIRMGLIWEIRSGREIRYARVTEIMVLREISLDLVELYLDQKIDLDNFLVLKDQLMRRKRQLHPGNNSR